MPPSLPIRSVNHLARVTPNIERMCRFYCEVLGFRRIWRPDFPVRGAWLFGYGLQIHLIEPEDGASGPASAPELSVRADHLALHVDDTHGVGELLDRHGLPYKSNYVAGTGVTQYFFPDRHGVWGGAIRRR